MLGTSLHTQGGISAVVSVWKAEGLFQHENITYVDTHCDGSAFRKAAVAATALVRYTGMLLFARPRLVHVHLASRASFWRKSTFIVMARVMHVPYVLHLHGAEFHLFHANSRPFVQRFIRSVFDDAAAVIVLSLWWQRWVASISIQNQVQVLYNAVSCHDPALSRTGTGATLLCLGRLGARKGTFDLLAALARLAPQHADMRLLLGGDGDLDAVRKSARELGLADRVELLGWISGDAKHRALERADVYVLPSYNEGLPMSVLEAMAAGLPIVSTPVGGIPEAVTDGREGFLVPPGDVEQLAQRISRLLADGNLRREMGDRARLTAREQFSSAVLIPKLRQIYGGIA
jgi:glycosyltransferase involved in cell wall biosynthesis